MMLLLIDWRNDMARLGLISGRAVRWLTADAKNFWKLLDKVKTRRARPAAIAVTVFPPGASAVASWSTGRGGVAAANTLAFAWGIPVTTIACMGDETETSLVEKTRQAIKGVKKGDWAHAAYNGEPNITVAKK